jgi:hypothetical protein
MPGAAELGDSSGAMGRHGVAVDDLGRPPDSTRFP